MYWILKNRVPVQATMTEWALWFEEIDNRRVAWTDVGEASVSTVFLGLDHRFSGRGLPILFETMISGLGADMEWNHQSRYATWAEAKEGHELAVEWVRSVIGLAESKTAELFESITERKP